MTKVKDGFYHGGISNGPDNSYILLGGGGYAPKAEDGKILSYSSTNGFEWKEDTDTDTKVTQTSTSYNYAMPILVRKTANGTSGSADTSYYNTSVTINPATATAYATYFQGWLKGTADNVTNVMVTNSYSLNDNYPIVWSNEANTNNAQSNQLYKTHSYLTWNPNTKKLQINGNGDILGIKSIDTNKPYACINYSSNNNKNWSVGTDDLDQFYFYTATGAKKIAYFTNNGSLNIFPTAQANNYNQGIRLHMINNWASILLCGNDNTGNIGTSETSWFIGNNNGNLYITKNGSNNGDAFIANISNHWSIKGNVYPTINDAYTLGTSANRWSFSYYSTGILVGSTGFNVTGNATTGEITTNGAVQGTYIGTGRIELSYVTPYIDFLYNNVNKGNYSARLINDSAGRITFTGVTGNSIGTLIYNNRTIRPRLVSDNVLYSSSHIEGATSVLINIPQGLNANTLGGQYGFHLYSYNSKYAKFYIQQLGTQTTVNVLDDDNNIVTPGTNGAIGIATLELGNNISFVDKTATADGGNHNSRGNVRLYSTNNHYTNIMSQPTTADKNFYLPNFSANGDMYAIHGPNNNAIGATNRPIYVAENGRATQISYIINATINASASANRIAFYNAVNAISAGTGIFTNGSTININGTAVPAQSAKFQVQGLSVFQNITPQTNDAYSFGASNLRFKTGFFTTSLLIGATNYTATNSAAKGTFINIGSIELSHDTPYIDFHFAYTSLDYSARIINDAKGRLTITGQSNANHDDYEYGSRTIKPRLFISGTTFSPNTIETSSWFLANQGTVNTSGFVVYGKNNQYGKFTVSVFGTASTASKKGTRGEGLLELGNNIVNVETSNVSDTNTDIQNGFNNARGVLRLFGSTANYTNIIAGDVAYNKTFYLPSFNADMYAVHAANNNALGNTFTPIYLSPYGRVAQCTAYAGGTNVTLNGAAKSGTTIIAYAPIVSGTAGQILKSEGPNKAPTWITPTDNNTWRNITVNGTAWKGTATDTGAMNVKNGTSITVSSSNNDLTISHNTLFSGAKASGFYKISYDTQGHITGSTNVTAADITGLSPYGAEKGITLASNKFGHTNNITAGTAAGSATATLSFGGTFTIPTITYDANGHITSWGTRTMTMPSDPNTHYTTHLYIGAKDTNTNAATTNGNTYIKAYDDTTLRNQYKIVGSGSVSVASDANGHITITGTDNNTDTKVTQTSSSYNYAMPILVRKTANGTSGSADTTYYNTNVTINPNSSTINAYYLNLTYNSANGAGAVLTFGRSGSVNYIQSPDDISPFYIRTGNSNAKVAVQISYAGLIPGWKDTKTLGTSTYYWHSAYITNIYGTSFSGNANTATSATKVSTIETNSAATFYPTFVDSNNASATAETIYTNKDFYLTRANASYVLMLNHSRTGVDGNNCSSHVVVNNSYGQVELMTATDRGLYDRNNNMWLISYTYSTGNTLLGLRNVGIGVNALEKLDVNGNSYIRGALYLDTQYHKTSYGIHFYNRAYNTWIEYMSNKANGPSGAAHPTGNVVTSWAMRSIIENAAGYGWIWESSANAANSAISNMMELSSNTGNLWAKGRFENEAMQAALAYMPVRNNSSSDPCKAGWYRVARLHSLSNYFNCLIFMTGGWTSGTPTIAIVNAFCRHNDAWLTQISGRISNNLITKVRLVKIDAGKYYLDFYQSTDITGSTRSQQTFSIIGHVNVYERYYPTEPTDDTTAATATLDLITDPMALSNHTHTFEEITNKITNTNEFNFVDAEQSTICFNWRRADGSAATTPTIAFRFMTGESANKYSNLWASGLTLYTPVTHTGSEYLHDFGIAARSINKINDTNSTPAQIKIWALYAYESGTGKVGYMPIQFGTSGDGADGMFFTGNKAYTGSTNSNYWGINTKDPRALFHIAGTFRTDGTVKFTGLSSGSSNVTDETEILTSFADTDGFASAGYEGMVYRRQGVKFYNYIANKIWANILKTGTTNTIPYYDSTTSIASSAITYDNGNITIPAAKNINFASSSASGFNGIKFNWTSAASQGIEWNITPSSGWARTLMNFKVKWSGSSDFSTLAVFGAFGGETGFNYFYFGDGAYNDDAIPNNIRIYKSPLGNWQLKTNNAGTQWRNARDCTLIGDCRANGWHPLLSIKTASASWDIGNYNSGTAKEALIFSYVTDTDYASGGTNQSKRTILYPASDFTERRFVTSTTATVGSSSQPAYLYNGDLVACTNVSANNADMVDNYHAIGNTTGNIIKKGYINVGTTDEDKWYKIASIPGNSDSFNRYTLHIATFYANGGGTNQYSGIIRILRRSSSSYFYHTLQLLIGDIPLANVRLYYNTYTDNMELYYKFTTSTTSNRTVVTTVLDESKRQGQVLDHIILVNNEKIEPTDGWSYVEMTCLGFPGNAATATSATSATNVTVTNNYTSDADYPVVWSNVANANSSSANQLYKSFTYLSWNAKNHFLTVNGAKETLKLNSASNYNVIYYTLTNSYAWSVGSNTSNQFYFWNSSGQSTVTYITYNGNLYAKGGFIKGSSSDKHILTGGGGHIAPPSAADRKVLTYSSGTISWTDDANTNTWRTVKMTQASTTSTLASTDTLTLKNGTGISLSYANGGTITIASTVTNTDTKVNQYIRTGNTTYQLLFTYNSQSANTTGQYAGFSTGLYYNPTTTTLTATYLNGIAYNIAGGGTCTIAYQSAPGMTKFVSSPSANTYLKFDGSKFVWDTVTDTNTDTLVTQTYTSSSTTNYEVLLRNTSGTGTTSNTDTTRFSSLIYARPNGTLYAKTFSGALSGNATTATTGTKIKTNSIANSSTIYYILGQSTSDGWTGVSSANVYVGYPYFVGNDLYQGSDKNLKKDIKEISDEFTYSLFLSYYNIIKDFTWKKTNKPSTGFIAQELAYIVPDAVNYDQKSYTYSVNYNQALSKMVGALLKKVKEQDERISYLEYIMSYIK